MNCCAESFASSEIKYLIDAAQRRSRCDLCGRDSVFCIDARELVFLFMPLLDLYEPSSDGLPIDSRLLLDFPGLIFANDIESKISNLVAAIFEDEMATYAQHLQNNLVLSSALNDDVVQEVSSLDATWSSFCEEIKTINRFHVANILDLQKLENLFSAISLTIPKGRLFYRARLSDKNGFSKAELGNPPAERTVAGRANPVGISYLYLGGDLKTTLYESRASLYDYVAIGEFRLLESVNIVDLYNVHDHDPFRLSERELLKEYMAFRPFLIRLGQELSKPKRPSDSELDYIPTQYLAEFIKSLTHSGTNSLRYSGIGYGSAQYPGGHNYAMFRPAEFECVGVSLCEIDQLNLTHQIVTTSVSET